MATIDHLRCRLSPNRSELNGRATWRRGIWVLSCNRCNTLRGRYETEFFRAIDPDGFYERGNSKPSQEVPQVQTKLCRALLNFIRNGGQLTGDTSRIQSVLCFAERLQEMYRIKASKRT